MPSSAKPEFDNETKAVDRARPFHRIHYKDFDPSGARQKPDGIGVSCGCTDPDDFPDADKLLDPDHLIDQDFANDILKSLIGPIDTFLDALGKLPFIGAKAASIVLKGVKDAWDQIVQTVLPKSLRAVPAWAPVKRGSRNDVVDASQIVEVEGFATRCYQNASDVPFAQWHRWYNWSIHIRPEKGYDWVAADTPNPPSTKDIDEDDAPDSQNMQSGQHPVTQNKSIECQWDSGALYADQSLFENGIPDDIDNNNLKQKAETACGPMFNSDWCWPMSGQYTWAAGRWVYDCGKSTEGKGDQKPRNCTMLNPCMAVASARWEAFKFPENQGAVPAIQFMFFASKRGGYIDRESISETDYEFIVDLPELDLKPSAPFPIGHTAAFADGNPQPFPHNTIVLRPRLLKHFNTGTFLQAGNVQNPPVVEVIPPQDPSQPPRQVKVTIPLSTMSGATAYGVIVSLGWHDPLNQEAEKVKVCALNFSQIVDRKIDRNSTSKKLKPLQEAVIGGISDAIGEAIANALIIFPDALREKIANVISAAYKLVLKAVSILADDLLDVFAAAGEIWLIRIGVNGRWFAFFRHADSRKGIPINLGASVEIFLGEQDRLSISVSGGEIERVGSFMFRRRRDRLIAVNSAPVTWKQIAESDKNLRERLFIRYVLDLLFTYGLENEPLGFVDAQIDPGLAITDYKYPEDQDPIWMDDKPHPVGRNLGKFGSSAFTLKLTAKEATSIAGPQCVYVEGGDQDFTLECDLSMQPQALPTD